MGNSSADASDRPRLVVITGLSGSGRSTVAKCFEDLGFYCIDNLPLPLLASFMQQPTAQGAGKRIAVVADVRAPGFATEFPRMFAEIDRTLVDPALLFLEASDETLVRRFSETRRPHPLASEGRAIDGIRSERELLAELRGAADIVFDTSEWSIHETRTHVFREFAPGVDGEPRLVISLVSFGFKHGIPYGTDLLFDSRFLPNPHFNPELRDLTGRDRPVVDFLEDVPDFSEFVDRVFDFLKFVLPRYQEENRRYVSVGIGCTGGHHRSVAACEKLADCLNDAGWSPRVTHRDISR